MLGTLFVVATPIGNLEDVTARALRVLREVALIAAEDTRRTAHLLARYAIPTPTTSLREHNEARKSPQLIGRLRQGQDIALVSDAGTPTLSDPGGRLIRAAIGSDIRLEPVPGPSAVLAALAVSGLPTDTFTFLGFPPVLSKARTRWFQLIRTAGRTVVFFEAPHRIRATLRHLRHVVGDCNVCVGRELTKAHEELIRGPITAILELLSATPRGELTVVVEIGRVPNNIQAHPPEASEILAEFGEMTKHTASGRRRAVGLIARRRGMTANEVYKTIEHARKLVE